MGKSLEDLAGEEPVEESNDGRLSWSRRLWSKISGGKHCTNDSEHDGALDPDVLSNVPKLNGSGLSKNEESGRDPALQYYPKIADTGLGGTTGLGSGRQTVVDEVKLV